MRRFPELCYWLAVAAVVDWLVGRTLTRMIIFMPKPPFLVQVYQGLSLLGQLAATAAGLLALLALGLIAWRSLRTGHLILGGACLLMIFASLAMLFVPLAGLRLAAFQGLVALGVAALLGRVFGLVASAARRLALVLAGLALLAGQFSLLWPALRGAGGGDSPSQSWFYAGEALVLAAAAGLWWAYGRGAGRRTWLIAALPALVYAIPRLASPAMTGILAIWSTGLTLYLPWPLYALALWLAAVTSLHLIRQGQGAGWAILLLAAGGLAPQLNTHAFYGLVGLWWLVEGEAQGGRQFFGQQRGVHLLRRTARAELPGERGEGAQVQSP